MKGLRRLPRRYGWWPWILWHRHIGERIGLTGMRCVYCGKPAESIGNNVWRFKD